MFDYDRERIENLRLPAIDPYISYEDIYIYFYRKFAENYALMHFEKRYGDAFLFAFSNALPSIDDGELIVGKSDRKLTDEEQTEWDMLKKYTVPMIALSRGQDSHMTVDYELLLQSGIAGVLEILREKRAVLDLSKADDIKKDLFYEACEKSLKAVVVFSNRYADEAEKQAENCKDEKRRKELIKIARICRKVPEYPAETFYEAVQSVHFLTYCLSANPLRLHIQQFQLGRPDRYLWRFFENDLKAGVITPYEAQTLLDCLAIQINRRVVHGLSSGYMVGGRDENGKVVSNELTKMGMRVIEQCRLVYPSVGLCCCTDTPKEDIELTYDILKQGFSHPAIFNDEVITKGLREYGLPAKEACSYIHSTCVEITPIASSNVWVASPYTNLVQKLLDVLDREYDSMEALMETYFDHLRESINANFETELSCRVAREKSGFIPLLSCFINDCLDRGLDIDRGGARYNWIMPTFVGMANIADSLYAIQKMIFENKEYTFAKLKQMLDSNFEGCEPQRLQLLNCVEKYGNDCDAVDKYSGIISGFINTECRKYTPCYSNARLIPSLFCWIMHDRFGRETGASPDGRPAFFPLSDGSGPAQGRERKGPTASVLSSTKWDHTPFIGGIAVNLKFNKTMFDDESKQKLTALVETYLSRGGFELQINVTDKKTLQKARENPELYQDLVVRIGGYSDYFVKLPPTMQEEVMLRTEHEI